MVSQGTVLLTRTSPFSRVIDLFRYTGKPMGIAAENTAKTYGFTREDQDDFAISSYKRAQAAAAAGHFHEIEPVEVSGGRGKPSVTVKDDEDAKNESPLAD